MNLKMNQNISRNCFVFSFVSVFYVATHANRTLCDSACKSDTDVVSVLLS